MNSETPLIQHLILLAFIIPCRYVLHPASFLTRDLLPALYGLQSKLPEFRSTRSVLPVARFLITRTAKHKPLDGENASYESFSDIGRTNFD